ncbi:hypothetical protein OROGR_000271 [Orobanche gracilis]
MKVVCDCAKKLEKFEGLLNDSEQRFEECQFLMDLERVEKESEAMK